MTFITEELKKKDGEHEAPLNYCKSMMNFIFSKVNIAKTMNKFLLVAKCKIIILKFLFNSNVLFSIADVKRAVDLCAAPGSWSQVLSRKLKYVVGK